MRALAARLLFKFLIGYLLLGGVVACLGLYVLAQLGVQEDEVTDLLQDDMPRYIALGRCIDIMRAESNLAKKAVVTDDPAFVERAFQLAQRLEESLTGLVLASPQPEWHRALEGAQTTHHALWAEGVFATMPDPPALRIQSIAEIDAALDVFATFLAGVRNGLQEAMEARLTHSQQAVRHASRVSLGGWLAAMAVGVAFAYWTYRHVTRPLMQVSAGIRRWAEGEFDYQVEVVRSDEIGDLARSANRMARQLAEIDSLKEEFLASCSHELKTPLTSLCEANAMMLEGVAGPTTDEQRRLLKISHQELGRMQDRTGQILDFSRIRAGRMAYHFEEVSLAEILSRCMEGLSLLADRRDVELVAPNFADGAIVRGDAERLNQVFTNLVTNAVKYNRPGGRVWFEATAEERHGRSWAVVAVCDDGLGIAEEDLSRIFQRFERAHPGVTPDLPGSGLGLAIAQLIVRDHQGELDVESSPGNGSRFIVRLPSAQRKPHANIAPE
ncbi:MAG: ATP-binding protein [Nitrospirota bacterium]